MAFAFLPFLAIGSGYFFLHNKLQEMKIKDAKNIVTNKQNLLYIKIAQNKNNISGFPNARFMRENFLTGILSFLGKKDLQIGTGHGRFDDNVHILSDNVFITYILKKNVKIKEIIFKLLNQKENVKNISIENGVLIITCVYEKNKEKEKALHILSYYEQDIEILAKELDKEFSLLLNNNTYKKELKKDKEQEKIINNISAIYIAIFLGLLAEMFVSWFLYSDFDVRLNKHNYSFYATISTIVFTISTFLSFYLARNSKRIYNAVTINLFAGFFFSIFSPALIYNHLNVLLDTSEYRMYEVSYSVSSRRSGKNTNYYFFVNQSKEVDFDKKATGDLDFSNKRFNIGRGTFYELKPFNKTFLIVRNGYFNEPYIKEIKYFYPINN